MKTVVIPPLFDLTLTAVKDLEDELLDLNDHFVHRLTSEQALLDLTDSDDALFARAAASVVRRGFNDFSTLRAAGVGLRLASKDDPGLRLAGDDVELVDGSTESSSQVLAAAGRTRLFEPELKVFRERCAGRNVHLVVETDQQLPAAMLMVKAAAASSVTMCGRFVTEHRSALAAVAELAEVQYDDWRPRWRIGEDWSPDTVNWVQRASDCTAEDPWAGWLAPDQVLEIPDSAWTTCRAVTVTAARWESWERVTGADGIETDLRVLTGRGVPVSVELLVGAPGVTADELKTTVDELIDSPDLAFAGLSPFRLGADAGPVWSGTQVDLLPSPDHDLARWTRFAGRHDVSISEFNAELSSRVDLYPGRFAGCCLTPSNSRSGWEPSAAVVRDGADAFVVNLKAGRAFRLHPKLAPVVERLADGDDDALTRLTEAGRAKLTEQLVRTGALRRGA
jgi:hypothetical protein